MDATKLNNVAIVSVAEAARLGRITDVLFATDPLRVSALKATGDSGEFTVPMDQVARIGPDAVMVEKPSVSQLPAGPHTRGHSLSELTSMKVVDEEGRYLGTVRTIDIDAESGHVEQILAGEGGMLGVGGSRATIQASDVRGVGSELITVVAIARQTEPSAAHDEPVADDEPERRQDEYPASEEPMKEEEPA